MKYDLISDVTSPWPIVVFVLCPGLGEPNNDPPYSTGEQEPWVHHGGLHAKFRVSHNFVIWITRSTEK